MFFNKETKVHYLKVSILQHTLSVIYPAMMNRIFSTLLVFAVLTACDNDDPDPLPALYFPPVGSSTWETVWFDAELRL